MYINIGSNTLIRKKDIIGIFDLDTSSHEKDTRDFLKNAEKNGKVEVCGMDLPKSFVVCDHPYHEQIVYLSQLNPSTLKHRAESRKLEL